MSDIDNNKFSTMSVVFFSTLNLVGILEGKNKK